MPHIDIIAHRSPNFGERRDGASVDMVVIHYTAMQTAEAAINRLCDPDYEVSAHYVIAADGTVTQLVADDMRAWHAGAGQWGSVTDVNSRSIGIEIANNGTTPFPARQMDCVEGLLDTLMERHGIPPERIIGHSDMAPLRKVDPGPRFDWRRLAMQGLSVWPELKRFPAVDQDRFFRDLHTFGYPVGDGLEPVLAAFRSRFRPRHHGPLDDTDMAMATDLAARFPVDAHEGNT